MASLFHLSSWKQLKICLFSYSSAFPGGKLLSSLKVAVFDPLTVQQRLMLAKCLSPMQNYLPGELKILYYGDEHLYVKLLYQMIYMHQLHCMA